jgi:hypothetical protein
MDQQAKKPATVSILETLATLPSGARQAKLDLSELSDYLATHYHTDAETQRNSRHALRDELYRDGGVAHMNSVIDKLFKDPTVKALRKDVVPFARFNNVIKRIVNEMSTVYSEPARRSVGETDATISAIASKAAEIAASDLDVGAPNNEAYQRVLEAICMDERMVEVGRLLNLHRALLVGFRVRVMPNDERAPTIDIATPANVRAVTHPNDESLVIGWMIRCSYRTARVQDNTPAWTLWTDHESVHLNADMRVLPETYREHGLGVCPWVPVTLGPPLSGFWPGSEGEDLVAGHTTIWFENVLLIKESKSATKQTIITGDGTNTARGQSLDSEVQGELADGQSATTVDMSMDLDMFKGAASHVLDHLALNYGLLPAVTRGQHAESAEARELQMLPLKGIRRRQQTPLRRFERDFAIVMSAILEVDLPAMRFAIIDWLIEFAESETPLDPAADHDLFLKDRAAGLDNTIDRLMRKHPGLTEGRAWERVDRNIDVETERNRKMRPLMQISGSMGASTPEGPTPEQVNKGPQDRTAPPKRGAGQDSSVDLKSIARRILDAN